MKKTATIILNRNMPIITDELYECLHRNNEEYSDIFVVESGSRQANLSKYCTWWANWEESMAHGLRYPRGFNFALLNLWNEGKFYNYDYFFLVSNDAVFKDEPVISQLVDEMVRHPRMGILAPCSEKWGERTMLGYNETKYFWYINQISWLIRREYIECIMETNDPTYMNFLYDGENFRGYTSEIELIIKGYANDWASGITTRVMCEENEELLKKHSAEMQTEEYEQYRRMLVEEGKIWMRRKYGFNSRWTLQLTAKLFYEKFFEFYPEFQQFRI